MSSISTSTEQYYSSIYASLFLTDTSNTTENSESTSTESSSSESSTAPVNNLFTQVTTQKAYGLESLSMLSYAAQSTFEGLGLNDNQSVSFGQILEYKDEIQDNFSSKVADELEKLGVPKDAKYTIATDYETGDIVVSSDSEYKEKIQNYFNNNPEIVEEFQKIQYLSNLERTSSTAGIAEAQAVTKQQLQSMAASFYSNPSSSIMSSYGSSGSTFGMGLSTIV